MFTFFFKIYLFLFRERGREGEREGEKQCVVASRIPHNWPHNPGMCPDWELNWRPFGSQPVLSPLSHILAVVHFLKNLFLERGEGRERNINVLEKH